jgi:hypothetical protein
MDLDLTIEEVELLHRLLDAELAELRVEVRHTRESQVKDILKHNEDLLRDVLSKLGGAKPS